MRETRAASSGVDQVDCSWSFASSVSASSFSFCSFSWSWSIWREGVCNSAFGAGV